MAAWGATAMSGEQGNMGWWLASDGRWYPPEQHADYVGPPTATGTPAGSPATPPPFPWSPPDPSVWNAQPQGPGAGAGNQPPPWSEPASMQDGEPAEQRSGWSRAWPWLAVSTAGFFMLLTLVALAAGDDTTVNNRTPQGIRVADATTTTERVGPTSTCLLYTSDAADERSSVDLGGRRIIKKKKNKKQRKKKNNKQKKKKKHNEQELVSIITTSSSR